MQPNKYFPRYLKSTFMITQLWSDIWYPQTILSILGSGMISWSKEQILDINKAVAIKLSDTIKC